MIGVLGCNGISWTICKQSSPRSGQITTPTPHHSISTGRMLFLTPNQQCQSTEGSSWYQKGKTNLDFTEARDSEWQWHQLGRMQVCTLLQTDNHASTPPLSFLQAGCPSCRPTNSVKALKQTRNNNNSDPPGGRTGWESECVCVYSGERRAEFQRNCAF